MQSIRTFFYCLKQGIRSIFHNGMFSLASIGTIAASLFLLGLFFFVTANVQYVMKEAEQNVGVTVLFVEDCPEAKIKKIGEEIQKRAEVADVIFISAEEAWENYKKDHLNEELAATFGDDNPLENSASYKVFLNDVSMQSVLIRYIESLDGVRRVNALEGVAESLEGINRIVTLVCAAIIIVLVAVAVFLIRMTVSIGISVRKEEISIMNLIGATDFFVRFPFVVEGVILGLCGAVLPLGILHLIYGKVIDYLSGEYQSVFHKMTFLSEESIFRQLTPLVIAIGVLIGWLGSTMTTRKQLRKISLR
ncbi:MAG: permease-like cell division protein FtsX [Lachnospiraceae bacterium]|nr:permease-like cell division protein FtsX [Lachnospiraceae bacterium]